MDNWRDLSALHGLLRSAYKNCLEEERHARFVDVLEKELGFTEAQAELYTSTVLGQNAEGSLLPFVLHWQGWTLFGHAVEATHLSFVSTQQCVGPVHRRGFVQRHLEGNHKTTTDVFGVEPTA